MTTLVKVRTAIQSHLHDARIEYSVVYRTAHILFAQELIAKFPNTDSLIDEEELDELWYKSVRHSEEQANF